MLTMIAEYNSQEGYTALMWAAFLGWQGSLQLLVDAGANKDAKKNVRTLFVWLSLFGFQRGI
jgi:hypothetical protein